MAFLSILDNMSSRSITISFVPQFILQGFVVNELLGILCSKSIRMQSGSGGLGIIFVNPKSDGPGTKMKREFSSKFGNSLIISASALNSLRNSRCEVVP